MKKLATAVIASLFAMQICAVALADDKAACEKCDQTKAEKMHAKRLDKLTKELSLTPDQKEKVSVILKESGEKNKAEMQKMKDSMKAMKEETDQKITAVLTPEQAQKYEKMKQDRKEKMKKKGQDKE